MCFFSLVHEQNKDLLINNKNIIYRYERKKNVSLYQITQHMKIYSGSFNVTLIYTLWNFRPVCVRLTHGIGTKKDRKYANEISFPNYRAVTSVIL